MSFPFDDADEYFNESFNNPILNENIFELGK